MRLYKTYSSFPLPISVTEDVGPRDIRWQQKAEGFLSLNFDGIPFVNLGNKLLECQHGPDRNIRAKEKNRQAQNDQTVL